MLRRYEFFGFDFEKSTTNILVAINIFLFAVSTLLGLVYAGSIDSLPQVFFIGNSRALADLGGEVYQFVTHGEIWRAVTSSFLHVGIFHLGLNMYALKSFGDFYERQFGGRSLLALYVLAGIGGTILSVGVTAFGIFMGMRDPDVYIVSVGASGALFGLLGYFLVSKDAYVDRQMLYSIIILNLFIGLTFSSKINNSAHIGGLIAGALFGLLRFRVQSGLLHYASLIIIILSYISLFLFHTF